MKFNLKSLFLEYKILDGYIDKTSNKVNIIN
jgi:hypothetical protein